MKVKSIIMFCIFCLMIITLTKSVLGYENISEYKNNNITYQLFSDGTAKIVSIEEDLLNPNIYFFDCILYNNEEYKINSIEKSALNQITQKQQIYMFFDVAPKLESGNSFDNITSIYIPLGAQGYTKEAGWPTEKLKNYKINIQPQDIVVTAGEIKNTDMLHASAELAVSAGSINYRWYSCDKDGNILDDTPISYYADFQVPSDLVYDNQNNKSKDYYFVCVIGMDGEILEKTRVTKVTVNPGKYTVTFNTAWAPGDSTDSIKVNVDEQRKLTNNNIPTLEDLKLNQKGFEFIGWSIDINEKNIIDPLKFIFDKNTTIYPIWQIKIDFAANGGNFSNGSDLFSITTTNYDFEIYNLLQNIQEPKKEGYKFLGFYDEQSGGKSLEYYMAEDGISTPITFYAQWQNLSSEDNNINNVNKNDVNSDMNNPPTGDNTVVAISLMLISGITILATIKLKKV